MKYSLSLSLAKLVGATAAAELDDEDINKTEPTPKDTAPRHVSIQDSAKINARKQTPTCSSICCKQRVRTNSIEGILGSYGIVPGLARETWRAAFSRFSVVLGAQQYPGEREVRV